LTFNDAPSFPSPPGPVLRQSTAKDGGEVGLDTGDLMRGEGDKGPGLNQESRLEKRFLINRVAVMGLMIGALSLVPLISSADVLVFKDGTKMDVEKAWVEGGEVKAKVYGGVVGFPKGVVEIEGGQPSATSSDGSFAFEKWVSGMTIDDAMKVAENSDIPLDKEGLTSGSNHFNPVVKKYAGTVRTFYYKENLLGKWSTVTVFFSPVSRLLWSININWSGPEMSSKGEFRNDVYTLLSGKYGDPETGGKYLVYGTTSWKISEISVVSMKVDVGSVNVNYVDKKIEAMNTSEDMHLKAEAQKKALLKNKSKH
jgi:hypothetical protein